MRTEEDLYSALGAIAFMFPVLGFLLVHAFTNSFVLLFLPPAFSFVESSTCNEADAVPGPNVFREWLLDNNRAARTPVLPHFQRLRLVGWGNITRAY